MMSPVLYLLGFPTPIVEFVLAGVLLFLVTAVYFGRNFAGLEEVDAAQEGESTVEATQDGESTAESDTTTESTTTRVEGSDT